MIFRGFTFALRPTPQQSDVLGSHAGVCRLVWNLCLEQRRDWHRQYRKVTGNQLNWITQSKELTALREEVDFIGECPQEPAQRAVIDLHNAFLEFYRSGKGFPKFKKKGLGDSLTFKGRAIRLTALNANWGMIRIPKVGWVKFRSTRPIEGTVFEATIKRTSSGWQVSLGCKIDRVIAPIAGIVGIDRGVAVPIALSDGRVFTMPESIDALDRVGRKAQRVVSRRKRGSRRHAKAEQRVRILAARRARIRKDWAHRTTTDIARSYGTVVIERLRTVQMTKSAKGTVELPGKNIPAKRGMNRSIMNVGWAQIEQMLAYKAWRLVKINPAYTSQTCAECGVVDNKSRKNQASFVCTACGNADNADRNAAIVILQRGNTALLDVEGCGYAPVEASTAVMATAA